MMTVVEAATAALQDRRLQRCLQCHAVNILPLSDDWLRPRGFLYVLAKRQFGFLKEDKKYPFTSYGVTCTYNAKKDMLVIDSACSMDSCIYCHGQLRSLHNDGSVAYENGDLTNEPVKNPLTNHCPCGFKHWWKGVAYENPPQEIPVLLKWNGVEVTDVIHWFQYETERHLNSNVYQIASFLLQKHFPGEFGTEYLNQSLVQQILEHVNKLPPPLLSPLAQHAQDKEEASGGSPTLDVKQLKMVAKSGEASSNKNKKVVAGGSQDPYPRPTLSCPHPSYRMGPGVSMLSSTPVTHNIEAMDRFLQLLKRKSPSPPAPDSPSPSTKRLNQS